MNNENNEVNSIQNQEAPTVIPEPTTPEVTPIVEAPVTPEVTPVVTGPSMPDVTPMAPQTPVPEVNPLMSNPMPSMPDATSMPNTTITPSAEPGSTAPTTEEPKKKNNLVLIIIIAVVLIGLCVGIILIVSGSKKEESKPNDNDKSGEKETKPAETSKVESDFLALANKYVEAVDKMWKADLMTCQDGQDQTKSLKPSELSATDAYGGNAFYYVFINTKDDTEMKLDVDSDKDVAGWIRVGKADNSYYVALSDGTNYIVDKGMEFGIKSTELKESDVVTKGNGNNYQYMNGQIFGSNSEGNGWGIGDYKISTDDDDTNDGIYMTNGLKTAGWTPFCSNVQE